MGISLKQYRLRTVPDASDFDNDGPINVPHAPSQTRRCPQIATQTVTIGQKPLEETAFGWENVAVLREHGK